MSRKKRKFQFEIRLGLALIVLVLLILNFASHYTIFRVERSLEKLIKDELSEAAVKTSNCMDRYGAVDLPDSAVAMIIADYALSDIDVIHLNYDRVLAIQKNQNPDLAFLCIDSGITSEILGPVLLNEAVFYHNSGDKEFILFYPFAFTGSKYLIAVSKNSSLLGSLENVGRILIFFGVLGLIIILYVASKFLRQVIDPFKRLREKAEKSGRLDQSGDDEVAQLISSYEKIIIELRQKEKELSRRMELLYEMSGGLAHQLRNSIAAIVGFGRMIQKKASGMGQDIIEQNVEYLLKESGEAEELVARFLDFAKPLQLDESKFELSEFLGNMVASISKKYKNIDITVDSKSIESIFLHADELLLKQAVGNLIDNACLAYDGVRGEVKIRAEVFGAICRINIIDDASGIPEEYQDKIFTPFFSGSPSGTGLGLPLAQKIIALHKGTLTFESIPDKGTTFSISLPNAIVAEEIVGKKSLRQTVR
jgi:two-component system nitrogen regulation sensor histidine kinase NtrY